MMVLSTCKSAFAQLTDMMGGEDGADTSSLVTEQVPTAQLPLEMQVINRIWFHFIKFKLSDFFNQFKPILL